MIKKIRNFKAGMTYVELIVVLSIFAVMTSVILFDYNKFQDKVDIKILANDIALKIVEAQKSALAGKLPLSTQIPVSSWKPSYGVYFDLTSSDGNKNLIYFTDLDQFGDYTGDESSCSSQSGVGECLEKITITKNNFISQIDSYLGTVATPITNPFSITFKRPDASAIFKSNGLLLTDLDYIQITITSPSGINAFIKIYPSGRIQIN
jgi:type II secretory pathway pseudopilin PulG